MQQPNNISFFSIIWRLWQMLLLSVAAVAKGLRHQLSLHDCRHDQCRKNLHVLLPCTKREILEAGVFSVGPTLHLKKLRGLV